MSENNLFLMLTPVPATSEQRGIRQVWPVVANSLPPLDGYCGELCRKGKENGAKVCELVEDAKKSDPSFAKKCSKIIEDIKSHRRNKAFVRIHEEFKIPMEKIYGFKKTSSYGIPVRLLLACLPHLLMECANKSIDLVVWCYPFINIWNVADALKQTERDLVEVFVIYGKLLLRHHRSCRSDARVLLSLLEEVAGKHYEFAVHILELARKLEPRERRPMIKLCTDLQWWRGVLLVLPHQEPLWKQILVDQDDLSLVGSSLRMVMDESTIDDSFLADLLGNVLESRRMKRTENLSFNRLVRLLASTFRPRDTLELIHSCHFEKYISEESLRFFLEANRAAEERGKIEAEIAQELERHVWSYRMDPQVFEEKIKQIVKKEDSKLMEMYWDMDDEPNPYSEAKNVKVFPVGSMLVNPRLRPIQNDDTDEIEAVILLDDLEPASGAVRSSAEKGLASMCPKCSKPLHKCICWGRLLKTSKDG